MRGKVARQIRQLIEYKKSTKEGIRPPQLLVKRTDKGQKFVLNAEGEFSYTTDKGGEIRYDLVEVDKEITQLHADPIRQLYKDLKTQWYAITAIDHKKQRRSAQED